MKQRIKKLSDVGCGTHGLDDLVADVGLKGTNDILEQWKLMHPHEIGAP